MDYSEVRITGGQFALLTDTLVNACESEVEFDEFLLRYLDLRRFDITTASGLRRRVFEILRYAQATGRMWDLVGAMAQAWPDRPEVQQVAHDLLAYAQQAALNPVPPQAPPAERAEPSSWLQRLLRRLG